MMQTVMIYRSVRDAARMLSEEDRLPFWDALMDYALDGVEPVLDGNARMLFIAIRPTIDSRIESVEFGKQGGRPTKKTGVSENQKGGFSEREKGGYENPKTYVEEYVEEYAEDKDKSKGEKRPRPRFRAPSIDEVRAYCKERSSTVDPEKFIAYYEANGWMVGRNHMKDWKAAVRNWESREKKSQPKTSAYNAKVESRGYDFDDLERRMMDRQVEGL